MVSPVAGHNASPQTGVALNTDPALDISHEHNHSHLHHSDHAVKGHVDNVVYSVGTTQEPSGIPDADPQDDYLRRRNHKECDSSEKQGKSFAVEDTERGRISPVQTSESEEDPRRHKLSGYYWKFRPFGHGFILLLFTG